MLSPSGSQPTRPHNLRVGMGSAPKERQVLPPEVGPVLKGANSRCLLLGHHLATVTRGRFLGPEFLQGLVPVRHPPQLPLPLASQGSTEHSLPESPAMCSLPVTHDQGGGLTSSDLIR